MESKNCPTSSSDLNVPARSISLSFLSDASIVLDNLSEANEDNWSTIEYRINEVASSKENNTVYVWHWHRTLNTTFDLEFEQHVVTRFAFNEEGKVTARSDLSEERLVQSQLGFSMTR